MAGISSDLGNAQAKATALKNATEKLEQTHTVTTDTKTTISGNTNAQEVIQQAKNATTQISEAILTASDSIHSVAKEFEAMDQKASQELFQPKYSVGDFAW
ncbi:MULTISPECIES: TIGR04197 family type VII secretion effector [unclassified Enterococcus]|uniref:TIGR04197 family type VII secretion effector n=1 Tax=unclassified Enterococcus TaxID=2608891 RepID=UPI0015577BD9|nr:MULTISPECIES: TIGR04197 family type VII secretion effector [unclassified Enterococcus]MBS7576948.1 TIGR04197 family type VII secretion effector [Enterococcus sp. MMGLQ5-2]MBS7584355.1 TIGR04197 family type VII secretion effector [Enterococcus sp. MMGLQ5-1]NPD12210.1 TIGR04197 family type VII secretion effector [Enterococcus sp. MMGLQ5-1]NPD36782.1 TIGR04197 family type VII secretion effector [Enterococcus sp. MMGLQ5-2]